MVPPQVNLLAGWFGLLAGVISGATSGLWFHQSEWLGGYASFRRRMVRLGHISFFGLGFVNLLFALSVGAAPAPLPLLPLASGAFVVGLITMPVCCYLTAWRSSFRQLFPIPVLSVLFGIVVLLKAWVMP
jgi:hypothetical protein